MAMLRTEYLRVRDWATPNSQRGFWDWRDAAEATTAAVLQNEMTATLCTATARLMIDFKGFFMGIPRGQLFAMEEMLHVVPGVTAIVRSLHSVLTGRVQTAYGLTDAFRCMSGTGQGCNTAPVRSTLQLTATMAAIDHYGGGFQFVTPLGAKAAVVSQALFADDINNPSRDAADLQLTADVTWVAAWCSGNVIGVADDASKTAYELTRCVASGPTGDGRYRIVLPSGERLPRIETTYRLLGHEMDCRVGNEESRTAFAHRAGLATRLLCRIGGIRLTALTRLIDGLVVGLALYYAGPTPVDWPTADGGIEVERRKGLSRAGNRAPCGPRIQVYASRDAGGLGQTHSYAHTAAATCLHVDKALRAPPGEPHRVAMEASLALTAHRLGFVSSAAAPTPLDWTPSYATDVLRHEYTIEAWLLSLQRAGMRTRHAHSDAAAAARAQRGRPPASATPMDHLLQFNTPPDDGGGPVVWECVDARVFSRELCQLGIVRAVDMYGGRQQGRGRWMTWGEVQGYYAPELTLRSSMRAAEAQYMALVASLTSSEADVWLQWFSAQAAWSAARHERLAVRGG